MSENGNRSSVDRERLRVAQQHRRKKERPTTTSSGSSKKSPVLFGSPIKTSTHLSERIQKNLGNYRDVVEVLGHRDVLDVYGADRLPETPISGSSAENHFEHGFRNALLASSVREAEPNRPSPLVAAGARMPSRPTPHKEGSVRGHTTGPSQGPGGVSSASKAKHKSHEDRRKASRENPLSVQRKAQPSDGTPDRSLVDEKHATVPPKPRRAPTPHGSGSTQSSETDMPRRKKMKSSKRTADGTPPPSNTPRALPPSYTPKDPPPSNTPRDQPPSDEGTQRQPSGKERVKKEKKHKDRKQGRVPAGPEPAPPISLMVEGAPPISQKVEGAPPISLKVEGAPPIRHKVEGAPPTSQQVQGNPRKSTKVGKVSTKDPDVSKKVKKVKEYLTDRTAGPESASHPPPGTMPHPPGAVPHPSPGTVPHPPPGATPRTSLMVKPFQEAKPVSLESIVSHRQQQQYGGEGGSKLRPGRLRLGEGSSDEMGTHPTQKGAASQSQSQLRIDEIIAEMTRGVVTPHSAIETPRKVSSAEFSFPVSSNTASSAVSALARSQPVAPGPYNHTQPKDRAAADLTHSITMAGGSVSPVGCQESASQSVDVIDDLSVSSDSSSDDEEEEEGEEEEGEEEGEEDSIGSHARDEGKTAAVFTPQTPILEKAMNMVKPLELITPIRSAPYANLPEVSTAGGGNHLFEPLTLLPTFDLLQTDGGGGRADNIGDVTNDNDNDNDSASSGSDNSSEEDSSEAESDSESSDMDVGVELNPPPLNAVDEDVVRDSGVSTQGFQVSSLDSTSRFRVVAAQGLEHSLWGPTDSTTGVSDTAGTQGVQQPLSMQHSSWLPNDSTTGVSDTAGTPGVRQPLSMQHSSWLPNDSTTGVSDTAGTGQDPLMVSSHSGTKSRTSNKFPRSSLNMLKSRLAQAPPSSASSSSGSDAVRLSVTSSGVVNLPTTRVSRIPSTESTAFQPIAQPPVPEERRRSSVSAAGLSSSHDDIMETRADDTSESGEVSSSSSEDEEGDEVNTTLVEEAGPGDEGITGPLLVCVPLSKVHLPIPTAIVHPKPQAEKQKPSQPPQAIVEPIVVTPVDRVRRHSRGTSRDADDGGHLRYPHRPDYSTPDIGDYPSHSMQHRRHERSHRSRSPRIHGNMGPQRRSHPDWRSSHHDRWDRRRRDGYHSSSQHWPSTADDYLEEARRLKHYGDSLSGHHKGEVYLEAALMFMMSSYENEIANKECSPMYIDTVNLLEYILNVLNVLTREDPLAVICLRCQAILYFKAFETKSKTEGSVQTQKSLQELFSVRTARVHNVSPYCSSSSPAAPSPASVSSNSSCHGTPSSVGEANAAAVSVPGSTFAGAVRHFTLFEQYFKSNECWRQSNDIITHKRDNMHFFGTLDERRGPISQYSSIHTAVDWAREGLSWFREDRRSRPM